jgi:hypothetical protein
VKAAHDFGVLYSADPYPCGLKDGLHCLPEHRIPDSECLHKDVDYDVLFPDPLLCLREHYASKVAMEKARDRCEDFVPFKCLTCEKVACSKHDQGRSCPVCRDATLCAECVYVLSQVLKEIRALAGFHRHTLPGLDRKKTFDLTYDDQMRLHKDPEARNKHVAAREKEFRAAVLHLSKCMTHREVTEPSARTSCCKSLPFTCVRCDRKDVCPVHEKGRTCHKCKTPTVCPSCAQDDLRKMKTKQKEARAAFARDKEVIKELKRYDARPGHETLPVLWDLVTGKAMFQKPKADTTFYLHENSSRKTLQHAIRFELCRLQTSFRETSLCAKHAS